jgi:replicative DNA helicase
MLIENILSELLTSSDFYRKVFPSTQEKFFLNSKEKIIFRKIKEYSDRYGAQPTFSAIRLLVEGDNAVSESETEEAYTYLDELRVTEKVEDLELLAKETEKYFQNRALEEAILECVDIIRDPKAPRGSIEEKIKDALSIEFDVKIGTDFFKDAPERYKEYIAQEEIIPTDIEKLNELLNGGWRRKAIHCFIGRTNIGKSLVLCHLAASLLRAGKNVLYITGEMSEKMIGKRVDANLLDMDVNELGPTLDKGAFLGGIKEIFKKTQGKLITKEYPAGVANANHIKNLLNEIKQKRGFVPDVIVLDYLNLFGSSRLGNNAMANSYSYVKAVAEEMRGLAVLYDLALITASQINRSNANNSDVDMTGTSESFGLPMTCDWMAAIIQTPELFEQLKFIFKNLKSRYNSNINQVVTVGVDYGKMRLVNLGEADQEIPVSVRDALAFQKKKEIDKQTEEMFDYT